jgi:protease-4
MAAFQYFTRDNSKKLFHGQSFGLVNIVGMIDDCRRVNEWMAELRDDARVRGVVLRVDSPGGGVSASQEIFRAVKKLAKHKPVVVSMGSVAASGGYYVSCPATAIMANPGTVTGSIGVRMEMANFMGLMDKLGVMHSSVTSGKLKDAGSPFRELSSEEREYFKAIVTDLFDQFVSDVAESRKLDPQKVKRVADGRILTGRQALAEGLIDGIGGLEEAFETLKKLCKVTKDLPILEGPKEKDSLLRDLLLGAASAIDFSSLQKPQSPEFSYRLP